MHIEGRVFIVTGASSGIGLSTAIALAERGTKVALLARTKVALDELAAGPPESFAFPVDMKDFKVVQRVIGAVCEQYGRIDGLVNSASIFLRCRNDRRYMSVSCLVPSDSH